MDEFDRRAKKWADEAKATGLKPIPRPKEYSSIEGALYSAIHSFSSAEDRWTIARAAGKTDAQLREMIGEEFGISGGGNYQEHVGGKAPKFWHLTESGNKPKKPTLEGKELVDAVRHMMKIPLPGMRRQLELF